jgi:hypothetical protein
MPADSFEQVPQTFRELPGAGNGRKLVGETTARPGKAAAAGRGADDSAGPDS